MQFLTELAPAVTVHPGAFLVDAILHISGGIDIIIGDNQVSAEGLGKKGQDKQEC